MQLRGNYSASAPGNMILMGEYAVLEGARAVLMTLRHRLSVSVRPSEAFEVLSDKFGRYVGNSDYSSEDPQHVKLCKNVLKACGVSHSVHVDIQSDIPPTYGFGSSAALVAALVKSLFQLQGKDRQFTIMFETGHRAILETFGRGSGADLAAALADKPFIVFDPRAKTAVPFKMPFMVQAIYTGYKTPTPEVLRQVHTAVNLETWKDLTHKMTTCVDRFIAHPSTALIAEYQTYMDALGVTCPACRQALDIFSGQDMAAKISGSGRGDCIVGFSSQPASVRVDAPLEFLSCKDLCAA